MKGWRFKSELYVGRASRRARRRLRWNVEQGFSLIEVLVVVAVIGILIAIAAPTFRGGSITAADEQAQALARSAANRVADVYAQSLTYQMVEPGQLGCSANCAPVGGGTALKWQGDGLAWLDYGNSPCTCGNNPNTATTPTPNDGEPGTDFSPTSTDKGSKTPNVVALVTRADTPGTTGGTTAVAVSGAAPANDCWFVVLHKNGGPPEFGYFNTTCDQFEGCWQVFAAAAPTYYAYASGACNYEGDNAKFSNGTFPADPRV